MFEDYTKRSQSSATIAEANVVLLKNERETVKMDIPPGKKEKEKSIETHTELASN